MSIETDFRWWFINYKTNPDCFISYLREIEENLCSRMDKKPRYGLAEENDFGKFSHALASICAYNNKQYYLYRAISNKNKVGFLSRKQYLKWFSINKKYGKEAADEYKKTNGRMISLYKMMSNAVEENIYAKFLRVFKVFGDKSKDIFEKFSENIMSITNTIGYDIVPCSVQEAYDLPLRELFRERGRGFGNGKRFAVTSCMEKHKISWFYDAFGAQAYKVVFEGRDIGRFLTWTTNKSRTLVDRLYCNGYDAPMALAAIDKKFGREGVLYYPFGALPSDEYIEMKNTSLFKISEKTPYIDSMSRLQINRDMTEVYLSNSMICEKNTLSYTNHPKTFKFCKCGKILFKGEVLKHEIECPMCVKKKRKIKEVSEVLKLYKEVFENESIS